MHTDHQLTTQHHSDHSVVALGGEFDLASSDVLREGLRDALDGCKAGLLLVDLSGLEFLDSTALSALVGAHHHAAGLGTHMVLTGVPGRVQRLLEITQVDRLISSHPTVDAALSVAAPNANEEKADLPLAASS